ncbi:dTDP-4-dehydrorhamnose reductase [Desulfonatronum thiosulfatophilum]|uniref:dTDP-4-dehydrorhamnose reductase n=1 Tax=Desulfonatronum thiosulfatophilum TaxID=617002 RepID=A0A1G6CBE6_9BACT|nr:dTDP-4-dehydrorhamnose reductase [Desulfonatronum thiosulfatophilum]SDB30144.1 dTDP-4-dehydrorhamnose reductase [Desulfonatronum thiosulfatophilum]
MISPTAPKVLVLGGKTGLLGQSLCASLTKAGWQTVSVGRDDLDLFDQDRVAAFLDDHEPDIICNTVAYTQVDQAEDEPEEAARLNHRLPAALGRLAKQRNIRLVHYSTDFVFDGKAATPYCSESPTSPQSVYGKTKLAGEKALQDLGLDRLTIIRTAWLFGPGRTNFVAKILALAAQRASLNVVHDQTGSPTYTPDLADYSVELLKAEGTGIFHLVNCGCATWCELAGAAVQAKGLQCDVFPIPSDQYPQKAKRPAYSVLDTCAFTTLTGIKPRPWLQALREYVFQHLT